MPDKPKKADGYTSEQVQIVKSTCLYVATILGDLMNELVIVGGLVPSLLINQEELTDGIEAHIGTMDLDLGVALAILDGKRYQTLAERLRGAGFKPAVNKKGNPTRQRWIIDDNEHAAVDFLIQPTLTDDKGGKLRDLEPDFAAIIAPGLHLAFENREQILISGKTIKGETAERRVWVCGPGAYIILKSIAFRLRGENKDAYDLYYLIRNYSGGIDELVSQIIPLMGDNSAKEAIQYLKEDFREHESVGPRRVAEFTRGGPDDEVQADVVSYLSSLLARCSIDSGLDIG